MMHGVAMNRPAYLCLLPHVLLLPAELSAQSPLGCYGSHYLLCSALLSHRLGAVVQMSSLAKLRTHVHGAQLLA